MACLRTASNLFPNQPKQTGFKRLKSFLIVALTYKESSKAKVANFDIEVRVDEDIMTLNVTVNDS